MIQEAIKRLSSGSDLSAQEMREVMTEIMTGKIQTDDIVSFLTALNKQGQTPEELTVAVEVMRQFAVKVKTKHKVILDTCGTGGDQKHTFNISTAVAFIASGLGIAVAKHGNRSVSSKSGSADILEAIGVKITMNKDEAAQCLDDLGIAFLFAPTFHPAMKYAMPARKKMATKTIFNFLGPLCNPAAATHQLVGVYDAAWARIIADTLKNLGAVHALVVRGEDGLDELTTMEQTHIYDVRVGKIEEYNISPEDFGFKRPQLNALSGGSAVDNAAILVDLLKGKPGPVRDIVILNAAAAVYSADRANSIKQAIALAEESIDSGKALKKLDSLRQQ